MKRGTHKNEEIGILGFKQKMKKIESKKNWLTSADTNVTSYLIICQVMDKNSVYIMEEIKARKPLASFSKLMTERVQERQQNGQKN